MSIKIEVLKPKIIIFFLKNFAKISEKFIINNKLIKFKILKIEKLKKNKNFIYLVIKSETLFLFKDKKKILNNFQIIFLNYF